MVAQVIQRVGTDEQKAEILPAALRGEIIICLGFSEPEAGSDVAAAQTKAVRDGDEWVINGQKMFTTNAHVGDYVFLLARTNPDVPKHKGLTTFLVPLEAPGRRGPGRVHAVGRAHEHHLLQRRPHPRRLAHRRRRRRLAGHDGVAAGRALDRLRSRDLAACSRSTEAWAAEATDADGRRRLDDPDVRGAAGPGRHRARGVACCCSAAARGWPRRGSCPRPRARWRKLYSTEALERVGRRT